MATPEWVSQIVDILKELWPITGGAGAYGLVKGAKLLFDTDHDAADPCQDKVIRKGSGFILNERLIAHVTEDGRLTIRPIEPTPGPPKGKKK